VNNEARKHLENALYQLKEKIKTANTREMLEQIVDSMLDIYATLQRDETK
jgi:hypothetical protein